MLEDYTYEKVILGECHGVMLSRRNKQGEGYGCRNIMVTILTEDDGNWFVARRGSLENPSCFDSYWLPDYIQVIQEAQQWIMQNCDPDPSGYGYVFREK